jgi:hypothetical protein
MEFNFLFCVKILHLIDRADLFKISNLVFLRERDHWGDPDVDERIILRWIFRKWDVGVLTGLSWLRTGTGGGHL